LILDVCYTDLPDVFAPGRPAAIGGPSNSASSSSPKLTETTLEAHWFPTGKNAGRVVLKLAAADSISAAELLAGRELLLQATDLPALADDTWFVRDLIGCTLFDGNTPVGEITGVQYAVGPDGRTRLPDAADLLQITPAQPAAQAQAEPEPEPALIPFIKAWLDTVDIAQHRVVMHLPPGLLASDDDALDSSPEQDDSPSSD
jgi:16S rRNA processing protein RimM